jgi:hypothetical protein
MAFAVLSRIDAILINGIHPGKRLSHPDPDFQIRWVNQIISGNYRIDYVASVHYYNDINVVSKLYL